MRKFVLFVFVLFMSVAAQAEFLGNESSFLQANYRFASVENDFNYTQNYHNFNINILKKSNALLYGGGFTYGTASDTFVVEGVYNVFAALTDIVKAFPLIPYFGIQTGIGYHEFTATDKKKYHEFEPADSDFNDFEQILYNFIVTRLTCGLLIGINDDIGANLFIAKNLTMDRSFDVGFGLNLKF